MRLIEVLYTKTTAFLRDVFQYLVPGFLVITLVVVKLEWNGCPALQRLASRVPTNSITVHVLICCVVFYLAGHLLLSLNTVLYPLLLRIAERVGSKSAADLAETNERIGRSTSALSKEDHVKSLLTHVATHLYFEMTAFAVRPDLHERFVERYNLLMFMRRQLASAFFVGGIFWLAWPRWEISQSIVGLLLVGLAGLSFYQAVTAHKGFLERTIVSYIVGNERSPES